MEQKWIGVTNLNESVNKGKSVTKILNVEWCSKKQRKMISTVDARANVKQQKAKELVAVSYKFV